MDLAHAVDTKGWQRRPFALRYSLPADHGRWQRSRLSPQNMVSTLDRIMTAVSAKLMHDSAHGLAASLFNGFKRLVLSSRSGPWEACGIMRTIGAKRAAGSL